MIAITATDTVTEGDPDTQATITINTTLEIYAYDIDVSYNPEVVQAVDIQEGDFLKQGGTMTFQVVNMDTPGLLTIANTRIMAQTGASGSGQISEITFNVLGTGSPDITLGDILLVDPGMMSLPL